MIDFDLLHSLEIDPFYERIILYIKETESNPTDNPIDYFNLCIAHLTIGDYFRAFSYFHKETISKSEEPSTITELFLLGIFSSYYYRNNETTTFLSQAIETPSNEITPIMAFEAILHIAFTYRREQKYIQAIGYFNKLQELQHPVFTPDDVAFQIGSTFLMCNNFEKGIQILEPLIPTKSSEIFLQVAYCSALNFDFPKALSYLSLISNDYHYCGNRDAQFLRAYIEYRTDVYNRAYDILRDLIRNDELDGFGWGLLGMILMKNGNLQEALCSLKNAIVLEPSIVEFKRFFAVTADVMGYHVESKIFCENTDLFRIGKLAIGKQSKNPKQISQEGIQQKLFAVLHEMDLKRLLKSPAIKQEEAFVRAPPILPEGLYGFVESNEMKINEKMKKVSLTSSSETTKVFFN
ncbi:TPR Domain containing protein [Histomonas meleagridis]|uniref:TPR Domain containing protein n=1 Tax=Histomonas meleagridis TaxID=135588 RepID=UPI00355A39B9|nr:TPR Domain containing protein [Histomonas meleagridis]KAH0804012.1 TPR Domain containing protein [Histomonas meleagridis]